MRSWLCEDESREGFIEKCLALLGEAAKGAWQSPRDKFASQVTIECDLANLDTSDLWDVVSEN